MTVPFFVLEAVTLIIIPGVIAWCVTLIVRDAKVEKKDDAERISEMAELQETFKEHSRKSREDAEYEIAKFKEDVDDFLKRVSAASATEAPGGRVRSARWQEAGVAYRRASSGPKIWRH